MPLAPVKKFIKRKTNNHKNHTNTIIIGAGPGGLSVAACLGKAKIPYLLFEKTGHVGNEWRGHYDRLHLHTAKMFSALPFMKFPKEFHRYPARQQVVRYFDDYAKKQQIKPKFYHTVTEAKKVNKRWQLTVTDTQNQTTTTYTAHNLVIATGYNRVPQTPTWQGLEDFKGTVMHSHDYKNGRDFAGKQVMVVGFGNSGAEIALDLWEHGAKPVMSVRSPVNVLPREVLGMPTLAMGIWQQYLPTKLADNISRLSMRLTVGNLSKYGLKPLDRGPMTEIKNNNRVPMLDVGTIGLIKRGEIVVYPDITKFDASRAYFSDGRQQDLDAIILATGYRPKVNEFLQATNVLNNEGTPITSGVESAEKGLYFCGFYISPAGMFREMAREAKQITTAIKKHQ